MDDIDHRRNRPDFDGAPAADALENGIDLEALDQQLLPPLAGQGHGCFDITRAGSALPELDMDGNTGGGPVSHRLQDLQRCETRKGVEGQQRVGLRAFLPLLSGCGKNQTAAGVGEQERGVGDKARQKADDGELQRRELGRRGEDGGVLRLIDHALGCRAVERQYRRTGQAAVGGGGAYGNSGDQIRVDRTLVQ